MDLVHSKGRGRGRQKITVRDFSLHLSRPHLPHTATSTRKHDKNTAALEIVHFLYALAYRTPIILTAFLPPALLLHKFIVIKVILDARRKYALDMRRQVVKRHADTVRHLNVPRQTRVVH